MVVLEWQGVSGASNGDGGALALRCAAEEKEESKNWNGGAGRLTACDAASRRRTPAVGQASHSAWPGRSVDRRRASPTRRAFSETEVTVA